MQAAERVVRVAIFRKSMKVSEQAMVKILAVVIGIDRVEGEEKI